MIKRIVIYIIGILTLGLGLVLNTKTGLGTSTLVSIPFVLSRMLPITLGNLTFIVYILCILVQIILYRKINMSIILQIPCSYVMGWIVDLYNKIITIQNPPLYLAVIILIVAICLTASGAFMMVSMDLIVNPGDGIVAAISTVTNQPFGKCKLLFDFFCTIIALTISLTCLHQVFGVGIGTVACCFMTGTIITFLDMKFGRILASVVLKSRNIGQKIEN